MANTERKAISMNVENVLLQQGATCQRGQLSLSRHHAIFRSDGGEERSIPYALLALVTRQPSLLPIGSFSSRRPASPSHPISEWSNHTRQQASSSKASRIYPLQLRFRTFDACSLGFDTETKANEVFETLRLTAVAASLDDLFAFYYTPQDPFTFHGGWTLYDPKAEFSRQGIGSKSKAWRFTSVNSRYEFCPTYPSDMVVPARISDTTLQHAAKYRSKARIPALSYLHWANGGAITRCAQPLPGLKQARSVQDEKVVEAIFTSHHFTRSPTGDDTAAGGGGAVYGATTTNVIVDARPTTNAVATYARGGGTENMDHYKGCKKAYLGIENIHVMRDSINRVVDVLRSADEPVTFGLEVGVVKPSLEGNSSAPGSNSFGQSSVDSLQPSPTQQPLDIAGLKRSNWLRHITCLLEGTGLITRNIHVASSHVMIHCSDGWDRTSQLSALAQVCLDPYYRTMQGFAVLVEKDWLSFGHRFTDRCGHGGSDKHYVTAAGHGDASDEEDNDEAEGPGLGGATAGGAQAAATAFWGFTKQLTANLGGGGGGSSGSRPSATGPGAHVKEASPVFTQFLDCVWQIMRQHPQRFEFNEAWLTTLHRELYECRFGTFLINSERERKMPVGDKRPVVETTISVWDYMLSNESKARYANPRFDKTLDAPKRPDADMGVLFVKSGDVRWWAGLFGQRIEEANRALEFEEAERKRRKAEKQRWEEERQARRALEEEEKRMRELDQQRQQYLPPATGSAFSEGGAVDLMTASGLERQNMNGGAHGEPGKLSYQVRAPKPRVAASSVSSFSNDLPSPSSSSQVPSGSVGSAVTSGPQSSEAAARFKSWAIGGWDRFQEAVSGSGPGAGAGASTATKSSSDGARSTSRDHSHNDQNIGVGGSWSNEVTATASPGPASQSRSQSMTRSRSAATQYNSILPADGDDNPWASSGAKESMPAHSQHANPWRSNAASVAALSSDLAQLEVTSSRSRRQQAQHAQTMYPSTRTPASGPVTGNAVSAHEMPAPSVHSTSGDEGRLRAGADGEETESTQQNAQSRGAQPVSSRQDNHPPASDPLGVGPL